jgi:DNA-binding beta-propeller fold protein YncE
MNRILRVGVCGGLLFSGVVLLPVFWIGKLPADDSKQETGALSRIGQADGIRLQWLSRYESGVYRQSGAEIVSYDPQTRRAFVVNAFSGKVDVLNLQDPGKPEYLFSIDVSDIGADANSVAVKNGVVAIAVQGKRKTDAGFVAFYDATGNRRSVVQVGALPDAVTFSPDGRYLLVANEGEPDDDYLIDPEGSVSIIDLMTGMDELDQSAVRTADFRKYNGREAELRSQGIRVFGPNASAAQDFEPEWIEVTRDSTTAYVCLQENNAIAVIDLAAAEVTALYPLGYKDWSAAGKWSGKGFDASDKDQAINIRHWPVFGMFQPDTIKILEMGEDRYLIGANEGDSRDWKGWSEEARVGSLKLDPVAFPDAAELQQDANLGRLIVATTMGVGNDCNPSDRGCVPARDCVYRALYTFGGRSMAIWKVQPDGLELVFDTGSQIEETVARFYPDFFNADHQDQSKQFDRRSPSKGPEPEGMAIGTIEGRTYVFLGLERVGGIMVYDVTDPAATRLVQYLNTRDFSISQTPDADHSKSDLGPEGLCFVPADESPDPLGRPLLLVGNEVSGTTTVYLIESAMSDSGSR